MLMSYKQGHEYAQYLIDTGDIPRESKQAVNVLKRQVERFIQEISLRIPVHVANAWKQEFKIDDGNPIAVVVGYMSTMSAEQKEVMEHFAHELSHGRARMELEA